MPKRILVADTSDSDRRLSAILAGQDVMFARTIGEAQRLLAQQQFDLVMIGVHFDDSRMFDLLRQVRIEGRNKGIPVVCVREPGLGFTAVSTNTLEVTCRALDANAFVDLASLKDEEERNAALRGAIEDLIKGG